MPLLARLRARFASLPTGQLRALPLYALSFCVGVSACTPGAQPSRCSLSGEARVAQLAIAGFDGVALANHARGTLYAWSDETGTFARQLEAGALQDPRRITERCAGGIALSTDGTWLGCMRPHADETRAEVVVLELGEGLGVRRTVQLGSAGRDGRSISLAHDAHTLFVAFEHGRVGEPSVQLSELALRDDGGGGPVTRTLSKPGKNGRQPTLRVHEGRPVVVFSESELLPGGEQHRLMIARGGEEPRALTSLQVWNPEPWLATDERGLLLTYRDRARKEARPELFIVQLADDLTLRDRPRALGRANSEGGPALSVCGKTRAAVVPLDHAGELYVAFHPFSTGLSAIEENHQYYASGREFVRAQTLCTERGLTALLAERSPPSKPASELLKVELRCRE